MHSSIALAGPAQAELPPYVRRTSSQHLTQQRPHVEHAYHLGNSKNKPWATLKVRSSAKSPKLIPTFFQYEDIVGSLELNLEKGDTISAVTVTVKGRIVTGAGSSDAQKFLERNVTLWSKSMGDPRAPRPSETAHSGKLQGEYVWPFSIQLPKTVSLPGHHGSLQDYSLPQTFLERNTRASIQYDLTVQICRNKLRADSQLHTILAYVPSTKPSSPSLLRQLAYQEHSLSPGPEFDPDGWKTLQPVVIRGSIFNARHVTAKCRLSVAKPLCYTRGAVIPCVLDIECKDSQAFDLLASPHAVVLQLQRRVRFFLDTAAVSASQLGWNETVDAVETAVWWPGERNSAEPHVRRLEGEIRLSKDLKPTSAISHFSVSYSVVMSPFVTTAFTSTDTKAVLAEPVEIATMYGRGPRPRAFAPPPSYETSIGRTYTNEFSRPQYTPMVPAY
jgi:hypothetical protein